MVVVWVFFRKGLKAGQLRSVIPLLVVCFEEVVGVENDIPMCFWYIIPSMYGIFTYMNG